MHGPFEENFHIPAHWAFVGRSQAQKFECNPAEKHDFSVFLHRHLAAAHRFQLTLVAPMDVDSGSGTTMGEHAAVGRSDEAAREPPGAAQVVASRKRHAAALAEDTLNNAVSHEHPPQKKSF